MAAASLLAGDHMRVCFNTVCGFARRASGPIVLKRYLAGQSALA